MVCIAAFIILALIGVFVAGISIFKPKVGKAYLKVLKKAWGCLWKKVRLQKCETGFKDDVKNSLLSKAVLKHPKLVKPLSVVIEVVSILIVIVTVWAILTAIKSLLALWVLGSCNVTKPSACSLGAEVCSIDESEPGNVFEATGLWFTEWREIFEAIPDKFRTYNVDDYDFNYINVDNNVADEQPVVVDIFDPGCLVCMKSYRNQKESGFFNEYSVRLVPFAIQNPDGTYKFQNSELIVRYMLAAEQLKSGVALDIIDRVFTKEGHSKLYDADISYLDLFNSEYTGEEAAKTIESWLKDDGLNDGQIEEIRKVSYYPEITDKMTQNKGIIENQLRAKGIPTVLIDGKKHTGLWSSKN